MKLVPHSLPRIVTVALFVLPIAATAACGTMGPTPGHYTRDSDDKWLDSPTMSTGLDKRDLDRMFGVLVNDMLSSPFYATQASQQPPVSIAIAPLSNQTTEHIDGQLSALLSRVETQLIRQGGFDVVSRERQAQVAGEVDNQQAAIFDPQRAVRYGKMVGTEYLITGKVFDAAERTSDMRRVQYMAFMQIIEVETGIVRWQMETDVTKAYLAGE